MNLQTRSEKRGSVSSHLFRRVNVRSQSDQQTHLSEVGFVPIGRGQTLSRPGVAQEVASGPENERSRSQSHVPLVREGHAVGIDFAGTQPHRLGRTQGSQQTPAAASYVDGEGVWDSSQSTCSSVSLHGAARWLHRTSYQRNHGPAVERNQLRKPSFGNQGRICPQPSNEVENRVFPRFNRRWTRTSRTCFSNGSVFAHLPKGIGCFPAREPQCPTILVRSGRRC